MHFTAIPGLGTQLFLSTILMEILSCFLPGNKVNQFYSKGINNLLNLNEETEFK